ncbi:MAG TPA: molybdopterin-dependent oxidoreductase, partial [Pirellulales bacterium]|nr:molybdopterin-dependent oxidoreductase [Pirellulales bacterium]
TWTMQSFPLPPGQQLAAPGKWPLVGERTPAPGPIEWTLSIHGCVEREQKIDLAGLRALPWIEQTVDIHCVTRWSKPAMRFGGVSLTELLRLARPTPEARYISFVARSERDHSTSLVLADALDLQTLVALEADGRPLTSEHGGPVRVVVPGRYFYKSLKWLERIELLPVDQLGYWEREAGYHNTADPWQEQRYMTPDLSKQEVQAALASRDFSHRNLRSLDARGHDLTGLNARSALLRDADFRGSRLSRACFDGANLTNAHFQDADLTGASLVNAGLEGADFSGADLRGADLRGASLFGATFCAESACGANIDASTQIDAAALEQLTPVQAEFVFRTSRLKECETCNR